MTLTKVGVILRLFPPPNTYRTPCTHDMLWVKKHRIFHSLNEATTSICYQTHILSEDGEHLLRVFYSLNESTTSSCYQTHILSEDGELPLRIFHSLNESTTSKLNTSKTQLFKNWLLTNRIAEQLPELAASWPQFCLRTVCGS